MAQLLLRDHLQQTEDALSAGRIDEALANCQLVLTHFPESIEAQRLLGEVYLAQGHLEEAQQTFDWILASDPENVLVYCDRALISERTSDYDTALDCYQQAYELSRGNSQIRQEFNQLSAKVGQPDFMFSRAGLARLYMRGDLLTQAIQEWEVVLSATPDRLDARTGLLEVSWREGLYDRTEQLARQILDDFPTCLKALLLLAYVTYSRQPREAQELIQRAEALDPELVMAHDLFSDLAAHQSDGPFLALLNKAPVTLPERATARPELVTSAVAGSGASALASNSTSTVTTDILFGWSSPDDYREAEKGYQESAGYTSWSSGDIQPMSPGSTGFREEELPTPPAWLEMLTHQERHQPDSPLSPLPEPFSIEPEPPIAIPPVQEAPTMELAPAVQSQPQLPHATPLSAQAPVPTSEPFAAPGFVSEDNDDMGWPQWLKSLGAATLDSEPPPQAQATAAAPESQHEYASSWAEQISSMPSPWSGQVVEPPVQQIPPGPVEHLEQPAFASWESQVAEAPTQQESPAWLEQLAEQPAQQMLSATPDQPTDSYAQYAGSAWAEPVASSPASPSAQTTSPIWMDRGTQPLPMVEQDPTMENLEQSLHSQGFVSLEPGTLSTIAQSIQEPTLSSALAQFGELAPPPQQPITPINSIAPAPPLVAATEPAVQQPQQLWPAQLASVPSQASQIPPGTAAMPPDLADALPDSELELTMKRPAIRLQPMQQRPQVQADPVLPAGIGHPGEVSAVHSNVSQRERLLKGYHYQLTGEYDAAMQEYRAIIRIAPELLGDVVSNVRALLKLAPKYSAGYRVLGDAYMRQGEYLQAMEAYNKALTMTKKAKGQISSR